MTVIDRTPLYCGPYSHLPADLIRPHNLMLEIPTPERHLVSDQMLATIRSDCRDPVAEIEALWSPQFYAGWFVVWREKVEPSVAVVLGKSASPAIIGGMTLVEIKPSKKGTARYSGLALQIHSAMAGQLYKVERLLAGAISSRTILGHAEAEARAVVLAHLEPIKDVLRKTGKKDGAGEHFFEKLHSKTGTRFVRALYGEPKRTAALKIGATWFSLGHELGMKHPEADDTEHQIPEIAEELDLLDNLAMLRLRAADIELATRTANRIDLMVEPLPPEAASMVANDQSAHRRYRRPAALTMTKMAYNLDLDVSLLFPNLHFMRAHVAAARAAGRFRRIRKFDGDPLEHWGLKAVLISEGDDVVGHEMKVARAYLRPLVENDLREQVIARSPGMVLSPLDLALLQKFREENGR